MSDVYGLLGIRRKSLENFPIQGRGVPDVPTQRVINANLHRLKQIEDSQLTENTVEIPKQSVQEVVKKVNSAALNGKPAEFTTRELRIISYYLMKVKNTQSFNLALSLLDNDWHDMFFNGLAFYVLSSWHQMPVGRRNAICELLRRRLADYDGNIKRYVQLREHADYFDAQGPLRMAMLIQAREMPITDAPMILGYKPTAITQTFYSDVIVNCVRQQKSLHLPDIRAILKVHNYDRTSKLVFAYLVYQADKKNNVILQTNLSKTINEMLGDVTLKSTWAPFDGATEEERDALRYASELVKKWLAKKVIETFFDVCVQDPFRKYFWLQYVNYVSDFKVAGSTLICDRLRYSEKTRDHLSSFFVSTSSEYVQTAALILMIRNKIIIEFSDTGSVYIYENTPSRRQSLRLGRSHIDSINDLKDTTLWNLTEYPYLPEGKMRHAGSWEDRLNDWMRRFLKDEQRTPSLFDDVPVIVPAATEWKPKPKPETPKVAHPKPQTTPKPAPKPPTTPKPAHVEGTEKLSWKENVKSIRSTKLLFDRCTVVMASGGFYLRYKFRFKWLAGFAESESHTEGSIWAKTRGNKGRVEIVHVVDEEKQYPVGSLSQAVNAPDTIIFREASNANNTIVINLQKL